MKRKGESSWLAYLVILVAVLFIAGVIPGQTASIGGDDFGNDQQNTASVGYATTISTGAINAITGAAISDANALLYANDGSWLSGEQNINAAVVALSTSAPNSMKGYLMIGNDANQGTDRGTEWYYRKVPFQYSNTGAFVIKDPDGSQVVNLYPEATTITWTGYDDGTAESTLNVTVGTAVVSSTELKLEVGSASTCIGNGDFGNPVGVCFNVSSLGTFNEVRPSNYVGTFSTPEVYKGNSMIGCYVLPTDALCDDGSANTFYRFYVRIDPSSNPGISDYADAYPMDKVWSLDDKQVWQSGWSDDSDKGTDRDPGIAGSTNSKRINFT